MHTPLSQLFEAVGRLSRLQTLVLAAWGLWLLVLRRAERRAFRRWLIISWALFRRRTFVVVGSGDAAPLPAPRIIGGLD